LIKDGGGAPMSEHFGASVDSVRELCISKAEKDGSYAVVTALFEVAISLNMLGFGQTLHPGAIEGHTMKMMESFSNLSGSLDAIARAIEEKK
jgi:hypothetical protein